MKRTLTGMARATAVVVVALIATACGAAPGSVIPPTVGQPRTATPTGQTAATGPVLNAPPAPPAAPPAAVAPGVDLTDPTSVADAAVIALWTVHAGSDTSPYAAELAMAAYCTPSYATELAATTPAAPPSAQWNTWVAHQVTTSVRLVTETSPGGPGDTATTAYRKVGAIVTPTGADGWTGAVASWTEFITLTKAANRWQVSNLETTS